jgi:lipopolysaccharide/colanic/teichoic acid biosynthesis glycosyltransferase
MAMRVYSVGAQEVTTERPRPAYELSKRAFDLIAASVGLLLLGPIMLVTALLVKLDSPGPVLYLGRRVGRYGKAFLIYKFRTMRPDSERHGTTTAKDDPRITRFGTFLRRYKLDEFPQLLNVLKGEMSIVGPRPEVEEHTNAYSAEERCILDINPGITDYSSMYFVNLADVLGSDNAHHRFVHGNIRNQKNQLRLRYVRNRSFLEDLKIILKTLAVLVRQNRTAPGTPLRP